jgi:hypothetical protein
MIKARVLESSRKSKLMMQNLIGTSVGADIEVWWYEDVDDSLTDLTDLFTAGFSASKR